MCCATFLLGEVCVFPFRHTGVCPFSLVGMLVCLFSFYFGVSLYLCVEVRRCFVSYCDDSRLFLHCGEPCVLSTSLRIRSSVVKVKTQLSLSVRPYVTLRPYPYKCRRFRYKGFDNCWDSTYLCEYKSKLVYEVICRRFRFFGVDVCRLIYVECLDYILFRRSEFSCMFPTEVNIY